jgi:DNA-directed RNA polymerase specialized sigma24 family protein
MGSVSTWINQARHGDGLAAGKLWERYGVRLTNMARGSLPLNLRLIVGGEDLANDAMWVVVKGLGINRWSNVKNRHQLWGLLKKTAYFKARNAIRDEGRRPSIDPCAEVDDPGRAERDARSPILTMIAEEEFERLLRRLGEREEILEAIARGIAQEETKGEIAARLGCSVRKVERKIDKIRDFLIKECAR